MPAHRNSIAKARLTGALAKDPQRYRDRKEPPVSGRPLGPAPKHLKGNAQAVWQEMAGALGWLQHEDRAALEVAAVAIGQIRDTLAAGEPCAASLLSAANSALGRLGASPADRSKVSAAPSEPQDDPFARFEI